MAVLIVMVITTSLVVFIILILLGINALWNTSIQLINYLSLSKEEKRKRGLELKEKALKRYEWYKNMTLIGKYFQKELYYEKI
jgi:predicted PurR-regulated permease PerM